MLRRFLPHRLTKPDALSRETGQHIEWIGKGDDLFGLRALALFSMRANPLERAAAMSLKAIVKYFALHCLFLHASTSRKKALRRRAIACVLESH